MKQRLVVALSAVLAIVALPAGVRAQQAAPPKPADARAVTLQDLPRVQIDDADGVSHGRASNTKKANRPDLGDYTFLSSTPGSYRRVTRITNRFSYVEHLETGRYVTFRGGLRVALGE